MAIFLVKVKQGYKSLIKDSWIILQDSTIINPIKDSKTEEAFKKKYKIKDDISLAMDTIHLESVKVSDITPSPLLNDNEQRYIKEYSESRMNLNKSVKELNINGTRARYIENCVQLH